jgi:hypothetical protein
MALNSNARKTGRGRTSPHARTICAPSDRKHDGPGRPQSELGALIEQAVETTDNLQDAAAELLRLVKPHPELYASLMANHEYAAARAAVGVRVSASRRAIYAARSSHERPSQPDGRVVALSRANVNVFLDFALPGGLSLSKATAEEVQQGASFYIERGTDAMRKGRWLERVAAALPKGKKVSDKFSEADLAQMWEAAQC